MVAQRGDTQKSKQIGRRRHRSRPAAGLCTHDVRSGFSTRVKKHNYHTRGPKFATIKQRVWQFVYSCSLWSILVFVFALKHFSLHFQFRIESMNWMNRIELSQNILDKTFEKSFTNRAWTALKAPLDIHEQRQKPGIQNSVKQIKEP